MTEANEEMHAQVLTRGLDEGKAVLFNHDTAKANLESMSIARELEGLSDSQVMYKEQFFLVWVKKRKDYSHVHLQGTFLHNILF